jgi:hypothetical protein
LNAVEIEEAISALAEQPFDAQEFPFAFLQAFGNKETTLKRLRSGASNRSDLGGVLQTNNIHAAVAAPGGVTKTLAALKMSPSTSRGKAKFILATDGDTFEAEDLASGETVACAYADFPDHFGFFLPLAGITTVKQVRESSFDIRATSRLNRLYIELLKDNPEWGTAERRPDMNHFMARLIFCFFAEDTDIFSKPLLFTSTIQQMSAKDSSNTHEVIGTLFRAMNTKAADRASVAGWFIKAADYGTRTNSVAAFVSTNSICQGQSVSILWPVLFDTRCDIRFAYTSFKWSNLASNKAGVTVVIVGIGSPTSAPRRLYEHDEQGGVFIREGASITPYLTLGPRIIVEKRDEPIGTLSVMEFGNKPSDGGHLLLRTEELASLGLDDAQRDKFIRRIYGSHDFINGGSRLCIWIEDQGLKQALSIESLRARIEAVRRVRLASRDKGANALAKRSHQLKLMRIGTRSTIVVPGVSSEARDYLPCGLLPEGNVINNKNFALYDAPLWNMALIASRLHWVWIGTVCVRMRTDFSYSNTLGWNTFPVSTLTEKKQD